MPWESFKIQEYEAHLLSHSTPFFADVYAYVQLFWQGKRRATLWFYRDSAAQIQANKTEVDGAGDTIYYGRFSERQYRDTVDLLRNEKPVFFEWNDYIVAAGLTTEEEPVGEDEP